MQFRTSLLNRSSLLGAIAALGFVVCGAQAAPMNKCIVDGTVTYQQTACHPEQLREQPRIDELNAMEKKRRAAAAATASPAKVSTAAGPVSGGTRCDGRRRCSQMTSCAEAKYFLANCPGVEMDGDRDGTPCEEQHCSW